MRIIVNHVTRMKTDSRICVAGINADTFEHFRPVTPRNDPLTRTLLRENGGPFGPGALVELGEVTACPNPPETEDHTFATADARREEDLTDELYLAILDEVSDLDIPAAFGPDLEEIRPRKLAVRAGHGRRSLAVVPLVKPRLQIEFDNLFLKLDTSSLTATIRVSDYRFYESDHVTIRRDVVNDVRRRISAGVPLYGMLGLARAVEDAEAGYVHWLMVNGLCLADRPVADKP
jgi:hypothetical protein